jgi:hypothetical protein
MTAIFRWSGQYFGFVQNGNLFAADGRYLGWVDETGRVWSANGLFLGEVVDDKYILRRLSMEPPAPMVPKVPPLGQVGWTRCNSCRARLSYGAQKVRQPLAQMSAFLDSRSPARARDLPPPGRNRLPWRVREARH